MKLLEMNHIKKEFDGLEVLKDISLSVEEGEIVSIIGPSGSGKSTLLRCATMLEEIDSGEVRYMGKQAAWAENGKAVHPDCEPFGSVISTSRSTFPCPSFHTCSR